jgi:hypothetical protein
MIRPTSLGSTLSPGPVMYEDDEKLAETLTGPGVKLLVPRSRTDLPGVKSLAKTERKIMSKVSPMSDEFHDWLDSCPVQWFRGEVNKDHVAYYFETPDEDEE